MSGYAKMLLAVAVLLLVLGLALTGCRKDNGGGSGGGGYGYLPAPTRVTRPHPPGGVAAFRGRGRCLESPLAGDVRHIRAMGGNRPGGGGVPRSEAMPRCVDM